MPDIEISIGEDRKLETAPATTAKKITSLIRDGASLEEAAGEVGLPVRGLKAEQIREEIERVLKTAYIPADLQRALLRAERNEALILLYKHGFLDGKIDEGKVKLWLELGKQMSMDPEIGLNQAPQVAVNIELGELSDLLKNLQPLEGFDAPVIDVEPEAPINGNQ